MSSYLDIAEKVLDQSKRPMSSRAILDLAYEKGMVPPRLYGKTQHKTLGARLSTDILQNKSRSRFFRTESGVYFLTKFLSDNSIPAKFKNPRIVKRRSRELIQEPVLAVNAPLFDERPLKDDSQLFENSEYLNVTDETALTFIWVFSLVRRGDNILTYRQGRYRESSQSFLNKRAIGFRAPVYQRHKDLFSKDGFGIFNAAFESVSFDLDISEQSFGRHDTDFHSEYCSIKTSIDSGGRNTLIVGCFINCPDWFEPTNKRLSLNDLKWVSINSKPNNLDDFDPWSQLFLDEVFA